MENHSIRIGITIGDPSGIGPEVALKAIERLEGIDAIPIVIGRYEVLHKYYPDLIKSYDVVDQDDDLSKSISSKTKYFINICSNLPIPSPGKGNIDTGTESITYIDKALEIWQSGILDAIVTGPVNKGFIKKSGYQFTGHTEYIAKQVKEEHPYMMMFSSDYRVVLVTTHIPVANIVNMIDAERIYRTILIGNKSIRAIDGDDIRLAITGLDPHCGDNGAIGDFDRNVTLKAIERAKFDRINIEGPFAADAIFVPSRWKSYNLIIAHYHDQGLIPFKAITFGRGVNVTLGLPIIRTSPDHGTAYDIAGKGIANYNSMIHAIRLAYMLVKYKLD